VPLATSPSSAVAALAFELALGDGALPSDAHLLPPGSFRASDGRPKGVDWQLDAEMASQVIQRQSLKKTDTLVDYEHQSLRAELNGQPVPAAGWFKSLEWREGKGLYATGIVWTETAKRMIAAREYRYISAVFTYTPATGEVLEILSVALTNTPALDGLDALADLARKLTEEKTMPDPNVAALTVERDGLKQSVAALTAERDGLSTKLAALTTERDGLTAKVSALEAEKATAALAKEKDAHTALMTAALSDGRIAPAQKPWAEKQSLAALTEYLDATAPLVSGKQGGKGDGPATAALSKEEAEVARKMGVSPEDYAKAKAA
jgi:phage I-like protein